VVCICGLAAEARIAHAAGFSVIVAAGDRRRANALVEAAAAQTDCLVSFGIAGGLAPGLQPGTVIVSGEVIARGERLEIDSRYRRSLSEFASTIGAVEGLVFGAGSILATQADKNLAWAATRALAVDLESGIVARTAGANGIPFIVLRAIADTAQRDLPPAALVPLTADGRVDFGRVFTAVLRQPFQLAGLVGLARETRIALSALIGPARALRGLIGTA
jgi:adenosylhomocysteine nucleosidase